MTMPFSGQISLGDARTELSVDYAPTSQITLNDTAVRILFDKTGASTNIGLADGYGKSQRRSLSVIAASSQTNLSINVSTLSGYVAGKSDITITVGAGVILSSSDTSIAAMSIIGASTGDVITLINKGTIVGRGGQGGAGGAATAGRGANGGDGGPAIYTTYNLSITNNGTIGGGGGGGGGGSGGTKRGGAGGGGAGYGSAPTSQFNDWPAGNPGPNSSIYWAKDGGLLDAIGFNNSTSLYAGYAADLYQCNSGRRGGTLGGRGYGENSAAFDPFKSFSGVVVGRNFFAVTCGAGGYGGPAVKRSATTITVSANGTALIGGIV
jgi:hypothetical protein